MTCTARRSTSTLPPPHLMLVHQFPAGPRMSRKQPLPPLSRRLGACAKFSVIREVLRVSITSLRLSWRLKPHISPETGTSVGFPKNYRHLAEPLEVVQGREEPPGRTLNSGLPEGRRRILVECYGNSHRCCCVPFANVCHLEQRISHH